MVTRYKCYASACVGLPNPTIWQRNGMSAAVKCKLLLYADDSVLLASGKDIVEFEATLSSELKSVNDWLIDNKLSLHLDKTQSIVFGTRK